MLSKLGEDVTETLERVPARWFVLQHVREKFSCRSCETITQPPAPFHPIGRGRARANLLAEVAFSKFGLHLPLHRQSERFGREGVPIDVSTLADWAGAVTAALKPLTEAIEAHVRAGTRIHADDTPVPVLATGKTRTGRLWTAVRDDRPFGGRNPPAAAYFFSPDRSGVHSRMAALAMIEPHADRPRPITLGADRGYDSADFVNELRSMNVRPHVAQNLTRSRGRSAIDGRTTRHPGYAASQRVRKRIEEGFGWMKEVAGLDRPKLRGVDRVGWAFTFAAAAYNLVRLPKLLAAPA